MIRSSLPSYSDQVLPLLQQYCYGCHGNGKHKGDLALDAYTNHVAIVADQKTWERVLKMVSNQEMPPSSKPQPSLAERELLARWIERDVFKCDCAHPDPGRVTIRRLNRAEYNNTVHDLLGVEFQPAEDFPVDDSGYGFDNIGDALSLPPLLIEKYLNAARKVLDAALAVDDQAERRTNHYSIDLLELGYNAKQRGDGMVALNSVEEDDVAVHVEVPWSVEYAVRVKAYARQETNAPMKLTFLVDRTPGEVFEVATNEARIYETVVKIPPGKHRVRAAVRRTKDGLSKSEALEWKKGELQKGAVLVEFLELDGPLHPKVRPARSEVLIPEPKFGKKLESARAVLDPFAVRAFRRPVKKEETTRLLSLVQAAWSRGENYRAGVRLGLEAILVLPEFLFRGELQPDPNNPKSVHPVDEFALASRLSYFLWSSMPDEALFQEARRGTLHRHLEPQVRRMLASPKSRALIENFAGQWLQTRNLDLAAPDRDSFPQFDESLRSAMRRETELFVQSIIREDRSIFDFLTADYTFVNERLAKHYDIDSIQGEEFQRVSLAGKPRKGILTQGAILTLTSNPTRTSPVKRGKWVLENLFDSPPPPPPPDVPVLNESHEKVLSGTLRQRMEQHRANPTCASCHQRMDPIGFGLENFDAIGRWREKDGKFAVDSSGELVSGESFTNTVGLLEILAEKKRNDFVKCVIDKMLTYSLGRGLEFYDKCAIDQIKSDLARTDYRFSTVVLEVVKSVPFQMRRGETPHAIESAD